MASRELDALSRRVAVALPRRSVLATMPAVLGALVAPEIVAARQKRQKKCKAPKVKCGKQCLPPGSCCIDADCGECQQCRTGACVVVVDDTPCGVGGRCQAGVCTALNSFGCTPDLNSCAKDTPVRCPLSTTQDAACFVNFAGASICATSICRPLLGDCTDALGPGAQALRCAACPSNTSMCILPVTV